MAFERFHNSQHRYKASAGRTPEQSTPTKPRTSRPASEIPTGWPEHGRIVIRFIRSVKCPSTTPSPGKRCACGDPSPWTVNDVLAAAS
jgi:hypothetical protein